MLELNVLLFIGLFVLSHGSVQLYKQEEPGAVSKYTRKQISALTKQFTNYYLYFGERADTLHSTRNGGFPIDISFSALSTNETYKTIAASLKSCVRPEFINRILTREQISWRNKSEGKRNNTTHSPHNTTDLSQNNNSSDITNNATGSVPTNSTTLEPPEQDDEESNKNNKIHNHLIFVMLLPHHPYSQELRKIITTVSPMFPQATVVVGNAYEFKDMTTKYYITSFPKILYFRAGIYLESYEGVYTAEDVAAQLADWMHSLPQAVPIPFAHTALARRTAAMTRKLDIFAPGGNMWLGLALQPLPLTVQYTLLNFSVPGWLASYLPPSMYSSSYLVHHSEITLPTSSSVSGSSVTDSDSASASVASEGTTDLKVEAGSLATTSVDGIASMLPSHSEPSDVSVETDAVQPGPVLSPNHLDTHMSDSPHSTSPATSTKNTVNNNVLTTSQSIAAIPFVLRITVPMPNVEPFLGSLENYAVWDSRMFLLAGFYVIVRVLYLLVKWVRKL